jgi:general secretion pathway protein B
MRLPERDQTEPTLAGNAAESGAETSARPDDLAPATEPNSSLFKGHVQRGTESGLMLYQDLAVAPGANLPELRLDLHVYAQNPQERFALINMRKLHEGDSLQGGVRVESITPDGVVMSHGGTKFLLPRD